MLIFAVTIGVVFAAGVVLIAVSLYKPLRPQPPPPMTAEDAVPSAHASAEPPPVGSAPPGPGPVISAAPPSTGTSGSSSTRDGRANSPAVPGTGSKKGLDAGAGSTRSAPPTPLAVPPTAATNPSHL